MLFFFGKLRSDGGKGEGLAVNVAVRRTGTKESDTNDSKKFPLRRGKEEKLPLFTFD